MSFTFSITSPNSITYEDFVNAIGLADLRIEAEVDEDQPDVAGSHSIYIEDASCRGIVLTRSDDTYEVTVNYPNALEDWELGLRAVESLATHLGASIEADGEELSIQDFNKKYNADWIAEQFITGADQALKQASELKDGAISIEGSIRPFYLGPKLAGEILNQKSKDDAHVELIERMRTAQFVGPEYFVPKEYELPTSGYKFVAFGPNLQMICPWVQYVALATPDNETVYVPFEVLKDLHKDKISYLDEKQTLLEPFSEEEWPQIIEKARTLAVDLETELMKTGVHVIVTRARERYDAILAELDDMDED